MKIPTWVSFPDFASKKLGAKVLFTTDEFFAVCENLIKENPPQFDPNSYTEFGKDMDGWETRRKRTKGHDWCIIQLAAPCCVKGIELNTMYFTGNFPPHVSIEGFYSKNFHTKLDSAVAGNNSVTANLGKMGSSCPAGSEDVVKELLQQERMLTLVEKKPLQPGYPETAVQYMEPQAQEKVNYIKLNYFPDGGVARIRVHGIAQIADNEKNNNNILSCLNGSTCISYSNAHYGHPSKLILPYPAINMGGGWETQRKLTRAPILIEDTQSKCISNLIGEDWCIFKLGKASTIDYFVIDTAYFKGNFPESCEVFGLYDEQLFNKDIVLQSKDFTQENLSNMKWKPMNVYLFQVSRVKLQAHHSLQVDSVDGSECHYVMVKMYPDGGISRIGAYKK